MIKVNYPQDKPYKPVRRDPIDFRLTNASGENVIYRDIEVNGDSDFDLDEYLEDQEEPRTIPEIRYWENLSLQDIVDLAPPGTKLSDIIFHTEMDRHETYTEVKFTVYNRDIEEENTAYRKSVEKYNKELDEYNIDIARYEKELEEYNFSMKQQQIEKLEAEIKKLKKEKKRK
jgi:hypothetical protein